MIDISQILIPVAHAAEEVATEAANQGVAGTLGLNLTYFIGQLITFSVVLLILWKFVFGPVAKKLTERTERVEKAMHDADAVEKEKQEFEKWKNEQMVKARHEASEILSKAKTDATKAKDEVIQQPKDEQQKLVEQDRNQMQTEKANAMQEA